MTVRTHYFNESSPKHTEKVLSIVREYIDGGASISHIVVATTEGDTGLRAAKRFSDKDVIVVTHQTGFIAPNENELSDEKRRMIEEAGGRVLTATHALAGVARSFRKFAETWTPTEIMAIALRTFGQGTKVCVEIAMMAADAGLVPIYTDVIYIGGNRMGSGHGVDRETSQLTRIPGYQDAGVSVQTE
ncbi:MAG: pyruvate kinase alpha/beta domain-containing protein [Candidatus Thorarchaeota archaeon]|nr:MAG: hypothetical protein DRP09_11725 [Candidatus Thorarchaeota archaeon]RLI56816.1 MAG: hypothetical protein DRO87_07645 [Candidatus Thorarchaeota archaeon]